MFILQDGDGGIEEISEMDARLIRAFFELVNRHSGDETHSSSNASRHRYRNRHGRKEHLERADAQVMAMRFVWSCVLHIQAHACKHTSLCAYTCRVPFTF
jgi:hypothetical protein